MNAMIGFDEIEDYSFKDINSCLEVFPTLLSFPQFISIFLSKFIWE